MSESSEIDPSRQGAAHIRLVHDRDERLLEAPLPLRCVSRSSLRSPRSAPTSSDSSASISCDTSYAAQKSSLILEQVADDLLNRHPLRLGHRRESGFHEMMTATTRLARVVNDRIEAGEAGGVLRAPEAARLTDLGEQMASEDRPETVDRLQGLVALITAGAAAQLSVDAGDLRFERGHHRRRSSASALRSRVRRTRPVRFDSMESTRRAAMPLEGPQNARPGVAPAPALAVRVICQPSTGRSRRVAQPRHRRPRPHAGRRRS